MLGGGALCACDLQPKIASLPDTVGDFISVRYPALLADPETQPEIYNSAAMDYGVYASPELYGRVPTDNYVVYASVDDYIVPPQVVQQVQVARTADTTDDNADVAVVKDAKAGDADAPDDYIVVPKYVRGDVAQTMSPQTVTVVAGDTLYAIARKNNMTVDELAQMNNLTAPYTLKIGQQLKLNNVVANDAAPLVVPVRVATGTPTQTRVELREVTVVVGDTLYSLSRKYAVPVNDLAVMNKLSAPFTLSVGQKIKVPDLESAPVVRAAAPVIDTPTKTVIATPEKSEKTVAEKTLTPKQTYGKEPVAKKTVTTEKKVAQSSGAQPQKKETKVVEQKKISSDPNKKLPKITARSSSKFAWPVRGRILSGYGPKSGGLVNDGINIAAARGTAVRAAENGAVAYAGNEVKGMGNLIIIQHSGGWMTVYAHLDSMNVRRGTRVSVGQKIGTVGETGKVDSPQLHFEIRKGTKAYNPTAYLKK